MNISKTLGRANDNDIIFQKEDISSHHAKVSLLNDDKILIEDLNSTNGTFVNGYRVRKSTISMTDELRLSENTVVDLAKIFEINAEKKTDKTVEKTDQNDFRVEFELLRSVWQNYQNSRIGIQKKFQKRTSLIRAGITFSPLVIWQIMQIVYINHLDSVTDFQTVKFWQDKYIVFSVLGSTMAMFATGMMSSVDILTQLDEDFRVRYVCPNPECRMQLGNVPWQSYYNQGKCFRCGAKYA